MPRLFWPNFDFEHELAAGSNWQPAQKLRRLNAQLAPAMGALCDQDDFIVLPEVPAQGIAAIGASAAQFVEEQLVRDSNEFAGADWELVPWGVTPSLRSLAEHRGWTWWQPSVNRVKRLNDRLTAMRWELQLGAAPAGQTVIQSEEHLEYALKQLAATRWVIKARFGMSGRERIVGQGEILSAAQLGWLQKRLAEQQVVILEPWLDAVAEAGLQFHVSQVGSPELVAVLPLINSSTGEYRGSRLTLTDDERESWQPAIEIGRRIAAEAKTLGYFGPLGIDVMQYRDRDRVRLRPAMDINARWTMGRIAWEWGQRFAPGENATWLVGSAAEEAMANPPANTRVIQTSSGQSGGIPSALITGQEITPLTSP